MKSQQLAHRIRILLIVSARARSTSPLLTRETRPDTSQFTRALGALTAGLCFLYVAWIFADSRHPAKSGMWSFSTQRLQQSYVSPPPAYVLVS